MRTNLLIVILHLSYFVSFAQNGVDGNPLQPGLYKTIQEFRSNTPSKKGIYIKSEKENPLLPSRFKATLLEKDTLTKQETSFKNKCLTLRFL